MGIGAIIGAVAAVVGTATAIEAREDAKAAAKYQKEVGEKAQAEQRAANAAQAARERRQQIREERVRRARILATAENTGTGTSSGAVGAIGSLSTTLNSNIGFNLGALQTAQNLSIFAQQGADAQGALFNAQLKGQTGQMITSAGGSIFAASGGFPALKGVFNSPFPKYFGTK